MGYWLSVYLFIMLGISMFLGAVCFAIGGVQVLVALRSRQTKRTSPRHMRGR